MGPHGPEAHSPHFVETSPRRRSRRALPTKFARPVAFAFAGGSIIGLLDVLFGMGVNASFLPALAIAVSVWLIPALVLAIAAIIVRAVVRRTGFLQRLLLPTPEQVPVHLAAVALAGLGAWVLDFAFSFALRGNVVTQRIAVVIVVFAYVVLAAMAYPRVVALMDRIYARLPAIFRHRSAFIVALVVVSIIGLVAGSQTEPDYFREVGWQIPGSVAVVFLLAIIGMMAPRWLLYVVTIVAGLGFGITLWHYTTSHSSEAYEEVQQRTMVTPWLLKITSRPQRASGPEMPDEVQACRPGEALTPPEQLGPELESPPDIVLITIDGWRWDHSSMDGSSTHDVTPRIASHARRGAVFERVYSPASSTRQSFRSMFTSIIPGRVGGAPIPQHRWALSLVDGQPTLAGYLAAAGYQTIALVSDPGAFPEQSGGLQGFGEVDTRFIGFRRQHGYVATYKINHIMERLSRPPSRDAAPRFIWTHLNEPHFPFSYGPELPTAQRLPYHERHLHALRYVDQQVDRLLQYLAGRERKDDTWVFITSDHGEQFDEHGGRRHGSTVYEEEIHVPLLVWGPGVKPGIRSTPVSLIDLMPTVLEASGLNVPAGLCGESLMDSLISGAEPERGPVYVAALPDETREWFKVTWIDGNRKLIVDPATEQREVFDLVADPDERRNLVESNPDLASELESALREFYVEHGLDPQEYSLDP